MKRQLPLDEEMIADRAEAGATVAAALVDEILALDDELPSTPPRYLSWWPGGNGLKITTDKAEMLVSIDRVDEFPRLMRAMIHPGFSAEIAGSC